MDNRTTWNEEKINCIFSCREDGMTYPEIADYLKGLYSHINTDGSIGRVFSTVKAWIYMLKDDMTREEAIKDFILCLEHPKQILWLKNPKWLKTFEDNFHLELKEIAYILYTKHKIKPTVSSLSTLRGRSYKNRVALRETEEYKVNFEINPDVYIKPGHYPKSSRDRIPVICYAYGHEKIKIADPGLRYGCIICAKLKPNAFLRHSNPLEPGIFYWGALLDSLLNDFKQGNTLERIGVEVRSKGYGNFEWKEVHKPIGEVEDFEELMKARFQKYRTNNPMLKNNGSSECFKLIVLLDLERFVDIWTSKGLAGVKTKLDTALKI